VQEDKTACKTTRDIIRSIHGMACTIFNSGPVCRRVLVIIFCLQAIMDQCGSGGNKAMLVKCKDPRAVAPTLLALASLGSKLAADGSRQSLQVQSLPAVVA